MSAVINRQGRALFQGRKGQKAKNETTTIIRTRTRKKMHAHIRKCNFDELLNGSAYAIAKIKFFQIKNFWLIKKKIFDKHKIKWYHKNVTTAPN